MPAPHMPVHRFPQEGEFLPNPTSGKSPGCVPKLSLTRILVLRGGALGDFILTLPALGALREAFPRARIELIAHKQFATLAVPPYADHVVSIESSALAPFFSPGAVPSREMSDYISQFDLVVSYLHDPDGVFESHIRGCGVHRFLAAFRKPEIRHAVWEWASPLQSLGLEIREEKCRIFLSEKECESVRSPGESPVACPRLAIHPGSGSSRKNWPLDRWMQLARSFLHHWPEGRLWFVGGEADTPQMESLKEHFFPSEPRVCYAVDWELRSLAALLRSCDLFAGHDSGVSHLAAAVQTSCILLFGPTNPRVWAPPGDHVRVIQGECGALESIPISTVEKVVCDALAQIDSCQKEVNSGEC